MTTVDLEKLREEVTAIAELTNFSRASLIPVLRNIKEKYRGIDGEAMQVVADILGMHPVEVDAVSTFYAFLQPETQGRFVFRLCRTYSCELAGKEEVAAQLQRDLGIGFGETSADGAFSLEWANCMGMCDQGPALLVNEEVYAHLTPARASEIVADYRRVVEDEAAGRSVDTTPAGLEVADIKGAANELTFSIIPAGDGLAKALAMSRVDIIDMVRDSKLKGRGGAGFPTGIKWNLAAAEKRTPKYLMCNADEGEPGTFKDRLILSDHADLVMEGMTIGARAIGASLGLIYLRAEYGYLRPHLNEVIRRRKEAGLLGQDIGGIEGFNFNIMVAMGAGAYVCGEETALIESLEGKRGNPRLKPPFPAAVGLYGCPTIVNNVETLASVPYIVEHGAASFKRFGTPGNHGTKIFGISGHVARPGVYEYPLGTPLSELLAAAGGVTGTLKAVIVGGLSVPILTAAEAADLQMDYDSCLKKGTMLGSGGIMVINDQVSIPRLALRAIQFYAHESCGQCTPCRQGSHVIAALLRRLVAGCGCAGDIDRILDLCARIKGSTLCPTGDAFAVPIEAMIKKFRNEFEGFVR